MWSRPHDRERREREGHGWGKSVEQLEAEIQEWKQHLVDRGEASDLESAERVIQAKVDNYEAERAASQGLTLEEYKRRQSEAWDTGWRRRP